MADVLPDCVDWHGSAQLHRYLVVDVFTSRPLEGNQLGVFADGRPFSGEQMRRLARELKFAETVFLLPPSDGGDVRMRIFTPGTELPFAGHPVLGTGFVVGQALGADAVTLETGAGAVPIELERDGDRIVFGRMQQPIPTWEPFAREAELLAALGVQSSLLPIEVYRNGPEHVYVRLPSEEAVASLAPDMAALEELNVGANCFAGRGRSWKTRMFWPAAGVLEDAATGSAAGPLAVHLARHGEIAFGEQIEISQGAEIGRPSVLYATANGERDRLDSVEVGGAAVVVAEGRYRAD
ncbi:MAG TPA: PhzF family phenazine biosynthesis protein [Solirubrobacteraceae bacterium]|nr:PhzF family phenazine biosynthesis protein [Solirubrobacteraceae bacterium]